MIIVAAALIIIGCFDENGIRKSKKIALLGKITMGEYLTELLMISNVYVQEVNKAILPLSDATEPIAVASLLYLAKSMKTQMSAETIEMAERIEKLMESSFSMTQTRKKDAY